MSKSASVMTCLSMIGFLSSQPIHASTLPSGPAKSNASAFLAGQVKGHVHAKPFAWKVMSHGSQVGTAAFGLKRNASTVLRTLDIRLTIGKDTGQIKFSTTYAKDGRPISDVYENESGPIHLKVITSFDSSGAAHAVVQGGTQKKPLTSKPPKGLSWNAQAEVWWVFTKPKKGKVYRFSTYDPQSAQWRASDARYTEDKTLEVNGAKIMGHRVVIGSGPQTSTLWIDSNGNFLKYSSGLIDIIP